MKHLGFQMRMAAGTGIVWGENCDDEKNRINSELQTNSKIAIRAEKINLELSRRLIFI